MRLTPGPRTSVTLTYNHRFDSDFFSGSASYLIAPQARIDASYTERIETSQTLFADNLSFLTRDEFGNFIDSRTARLFALGDNANFGLQDMLSACVPSIRVFMRFAAGTSLTRSGTMSGATSMRPANGIWRRGAR